MLDVVGVCGGSCTEDADGDGICDDIDDCIGQLDFCGECNGPGPLPGFDCDGNPIDGECSEVCLVTSESIENQVVSCPEELDNVLCNPNITAYNNCTGNDVGVSCAPLVFRSARNTCIASTANGIGNDGALVLFGITTFGVSSTYYEPTGPGLTFTEYPDNQTAILEGRVQGVTDPDEQWDIFIVYENGVSGAEWGGGFKTAFTCEPTQEITDSWNIYTMKDDQAYLTGVDGSALEGSLLFLSHAPANEYFGFQVGEMANDRNCNYGAGGWFGWQGHLYHEMNQVAGSNGDVLVDLTCAGNQLSSACDDEALIIYSLIDTSCATLTNYVQSFTYLDTVAPTFIDAPQDLTISCTDELPALESFSAEDNCVSNGTPVITYNGEAMTDSTGSGCRVVERSWSATDDCGNTAIHIQTITIADTLAPVITGGQDGQAECDGNGNESELADWLATRGGADAVDNCGNVEWQPPTMSGMTAGCGETGSVTYTFTAVDDCGNSASVDLSFHIVDTTAPVASGSQDYDIVCGDYNDTALYDITGTDQCGGEVTIEIDSVNLQTGTCPIVMFRTYKLTDECGNASYYEQAVNLYDSIAPVLSIDSCPVGDTLLVDALCEADTSVATMGTPVISSEDACDDAPLLGLSHMDQVTSDCAGHMLIERVWTATAIDACDNADTATCTQIILVQDLAGPSLEVSCLSDTTITRDADCNADASPAALGMPEVNTSDACGGEVMVNISHIDSDTTMACGGELSFLRTWTVTATDECQNTTSDNTCTQTITILDELAPILTLSDTISMACDVFNDTTLYDVTAEDNCSEVMLILESQTEGDLSCAGSMLRTYRATDDCGNSATAQQVILLLDTVAPSLVIECPASDTLYVDAMCAADTLPSTLGMATAMALDNCTETTLDIQHSDLTEATCEGGMLISRTWTATATDQCSNETVVSCVQTILLVDTVAPSLSITCPADTTVAKDADCQALISPEALGVPAIESDDNCLDTPEITTVFVDSNTLNPCPGEYSFLRTWTVMAEDDCGNATSTSCVQAISVIDTLAPVVTADTSVTMDCSVFNDTALYGISALDNCSDASTTILSQEPFSGACAGTMERIYQIQDECGNLTTFQQFIHLTDSIAPVVTIECPAGDTLAVNALCEVDLTTDALGMATAECNDNCDADPSTVITFTDELTPICAGSQLLERTWMAVGQDQCGNTDTATCVQSVLIEDLIAPTISLTCPDTATILLDELCTATADSSETGSPDIITSENCGGPVSVDLTYVDGDTVATCGSAFEFTRTWTALGTDDCGNQSTATCSQLIQAVDLMAPTWPDAGIYIYAPCDSLTDATDPTQLALEAVDNCSDVTYSIEVEFFSGGCPGTYDRIWTATDACGNSSSVSQYVVLFDPQAPEIVCPADTTLFLDDNCANDLSTEVLGMAEASDNCADVQDISLSYVDAEPAIDCLGDDDNPEGSRTILRTFYAEDLCENVDSCVQTITLLDTLAPMATVLGDTIACELYSDTVEYGSFTATDNCDSDVAYTWQVDSVLLGSCQGSYAVNRSYTFVDDCGNATTVQQVITVIDETAPVIMGDMVAMVACQVYDTDSSAVYISAEDNCGNVTITFTDTPFSGGCVQPEATYMRDYTVTDDCGNTAMFTQFIELIDTIAPALSINCPASIELFSNDTCGVDAGTEQTGLPDIDVSDNCCADIQLSTSFVDGPADTTCMGSYSFTRTFTVTAEDDCFNTTVETCTQLITVTDTVAPTLFCPADLVVECDGNGNLTELNDWLASVAAADNCSGAAISHDYTALIDSCGATGDALVTFTAVDSCGNSTSCTATFTILDTTAPSVLDAMDLTVQCGADNDSTLNEWLAAHGGASAADSCSGVMWSHDFEGLSDDCGATGSALVTFTATDACGNAASTSATFAIIDTLAPVFENSALSYTIACDLFDTTTVYDVMATDECGLVILTVTSNDEIIGTCPASYIRTYTATDACGNTATFEQAVNTIDTVAPVFDFVPEDYTALCHEEHPLDMATATDNCAALATVTVVSDTLVSADCPQTYTVTRTFTAEDECTNTSVAVQVIEIVDTLAPTFVEGLPGDTLVQCHDVPAADVLTATDLCQEVDVLFSEDTTMSGNCPQSYTLTRTWSVADACGNATAHTQVVTVTDTLAPTIDLPAMDLTVECDGMGNTDSYDAWLDSLGGASASDLCGPVIWSHAVDTVMEACGGTAGTTVVTFTAADSCGNASATTASFIIEDNTLPTFEGDSLVQVMCADYSDSVLYGFSADDVCSDVAIAILDSAIEGPCAGAFERTYTVSDACGNAVNFVQTVHLYDSIPPVFTHVPADTTLLCNEMWDLDSLGTAMAEDNCLGSVTISYSDSVLVSDSLDVDCYVIDRMWVATDVCGNEKSVMQTITIADTLAPTLTVLYPLDTTLVADPDDCSANTDVDLLGFPLATAADNCDNDIDIDITYVDSTVADCGGARTILRTWTILATDNCQNVGSTGQVQTITILDQTAPVLTVEAPMDAMIEQTADCNVYLGADSLGLVEATAVDACDDDVEVVITYMDGEPQYGCAADDSLAQGDYSLLRTFTVIATDACGNADTAVVEQLIQVNDNIAPQFTETCDIDNNGTITVCCEDESGVVSVPDSCAVLFEDNCDTEVGLTYTETYLGDYAPTAEVDRFCSAVTPAAFSDGETCSGFTPHSMRMFNLPGGAEFYVATSPGVIEHRNDGTWVLTQSVLATDGSGGGWDIEATYGEAMDWDAWSNQSMPTSFKRDCGDLIDDHENWAYRILQSGSLTGTGTYDGASFFLTHAPANEYYAFQIGYGANNMNDTYGYSGWFNYSGNFNGLTVMGSGDFFGEMDCCLPWAIDRAYTVVDDCGNTNEFNYTVEVNGGDCLEDPDAQVSGNSGPDHGPAILSGAGDITTGKTPIRVTNLQPNPTNDWSQLGFEVSGNSRVTVTLFTMDGLLVEQLFDGMAAPGVNHSLDIAADQLESGMYQIRLSNSTYMMVKKLLVTE